MKKEEESSMQRSRDFPAALGADIPQPVGSRPCRSSFSAGPVTIWATHIGGAYSWNTAPHGKDGWWTTPSSPLCASQGLEVELWVKFSLGRREQLGKASLCVCVVSYLLLFIIILLCLTDYKLNLFSQVKSAYPIMIIGKWSVLSWPVCSL